MRVIEVEKQPILVLQSQQPLNRCTSPHTVSTVSNIRDQRMTLAHILDKIDIIVIASDNLRFITTDSLDLIQCKMGMFIKNQNRALAIGKHTGCQQGQRRDDARAAGSRCECSTIEMRR
ncbi:hypothetical protein D3C85_1252220 [compost metagenome]